MITSFMPFRRWSGNVRMWFGYLKFRVGLNRGRIAIAGTRLGYDAPNCPQKNCSKKRTNSKKLERKTTNPKQLRRKARRYWALLSRLATREQARGSRRTAC